MSKITVGIDISKAKFDAAIFYESTKFKTKKFENKLSGFAELTDWLKKHKAIGPHICLEATGTYGEALATYLFEASYLISVVNPAQIKGFAQSELVRNKTDKADSKLIARFCRAMNPPLWQPKPRHIRKLGDWVRRLESLQGLYQQEANRLEVASSADIRASIETILKHLKTEISEVKKKINVILMSTLIYEKKRNC